MSKFCRPKLGDVVIVFDDWCGVKIYVYCIFIKGFSWVLCEIVYFVGVTL